MSNGDKNKKCSMSTFSFENNATDFYFSQQIGQYKVMHKLGQGRYGLVKLGVSQVTGLKAAIKIIGKSALNEEERQCVRTEAEVMNFVRHPNIVALYHVVCLCMEFAGGGELFEYIVKQTRLEEQEARKLWIQTLEGVGYCHDRRIVHRDIKAENIFLDESLQTVKVGDWGFSAICKPDEKIETACGSLDYAAPEVLSGQAFGPEVDVWSLGVLLYFMVCGVLPFRASNDFEVFQRIKSGKFRPLPSFVSEDLKQLLESIFIPDNGRRPTIRELLQHPWCLMARREALQFPQLPIPLQNQIKQKVKLKDNEKDSQEHRWPSRSPPRKRNEILHSSQLRYSPRSGSPLRTNSLVDSPRKYSPPSGSPHTASPRGSPMSQSPRSGNSPRDKIQIPLGRKKNEHQDHIGPHVVIIEPSETIKQQQQQNHLQQQEHRMQFIKNICEERHKHMTEALKHQPDEPLKLSPPKRYTTSSPLSSSPTKISELSSALERTRPHRHQPADHEEVPSDCDEKKKKRGKSSKHSRRESRTPKKSDEFRPCLANSDTVSPRKEVNKTRRNSEPPTPSPKKETKDKKRRRRKRGRRELREEEEEGDEPNEEFVFQDSKLEEIFGNPYESDSGISFSESDDMIQPGSLNWSFNKNNPSRSYSARITGVGRNPFLEIEEEEEGGVGKQHSGADKEGDGDEGGEEGAPDETAAHEKRGLRRSARRRSHRRSHRRSDKSRGSSENSPRHYYYDRKTERLSPNCQENERQPDDQTGSPKKVNKTLQRSSRSRSRSPVEDKNNTPPVIHHKTEPETKKETKKWSIFEHKTSDPSPKKKKTRPAKSKSLAPSDSLIQQLHSHRHEADEGVEPTTKLATKKRSKSRSLSPGPPQSMSLWKEIVHYHKSKKSTSGEAYKKSDRIPEFSSSDPNSSSGSGKHHITAKPADDHNIDDVLVSSPITIQPASPRDTQVSPPVAAAAPSKHYSPPAKPSRRLSSSNPHVRPKSPGHVPPLPLSSSSPTTHPHQHMTCPMTSSSPTVSMHVSPSPNPNHLSPSHIHVSQSTSPQQRQPSPPSSSPPSTASPSPPSPTRQHPPHQRHLKPKLHLQLQLVQQRVESSSPEPREDPDKSYLQHFKKAKTYPEITTTGKIEGLARNSSHGSPKTLARKSPTHMDSDSDRSRSPRTGSRKLNPSPRDPDEEILRASPRAPPRKPVPSPRDNLRLDMEEDAPNIPNVPPTLAPVGPTRSVSDPSAIGIKKSKNTRSPKISKRLQPQRSSDFSILHLSQEQLEKLRASRKDLYILDVIDTPTTGDSPSPSLASSTDREPDSSRATVIVSARSITANSPAPTMKLLRNLETNGIPGKFTPKLTRSTSVGEIMTPIFPVTAEKEVTRPQSARGAPTRPRTKTWSSSKTKTFLQLEDGTQLTLEPRSFSPILSADTTTSSSDISPTATPTPNPLTPSATPATSPGAPKRNLPSNKKIKLRLSAVRPGQKTAVRTNSGTPCPSSTDPTTTSESALPSQIPEPNSLDLDTTPQTLPVKYVDFFNTT